jgi:hypothetical protein
MQQDMEVRRALETIQSVLAGVSTTAHSRNLESLIDLVELALWHPDEQRTLVRMRTPQVRRGLQGVEQDGGAAPDSVTYWRN